MRGSSLLGRSRGRTCGLVVGLPLLVYRKLKIVLGQLIWSVHRDAMWRLSPKPECVRRFVRCWRWWGAIAVVVALLNGSLSFGLHVVLMLLKVRSTKYRWLLFCWLLRGLRPLGIVLGRAAFGFLGFLFLLVYSGHDMGESPGQHIVRFIELIRADGEIVDRLVRITVLSFEQEALDTVSARPNVENSHHSVTYGTNQLSCVVLSSEHSVEQRQGGVQTN